MKFLRRFAKNRNGWNLGENVKVRPKIWNLIPWVSNYTAQAIYPNIYFSEKVYEKLSSLDPDSKYVAALIHEQTHIERQKRLGWIKWGVRYVFSPKFRFNEELEAIKVSMKYLKRKRIGFDFEKKAKILSGWLYFWPVLYKFAKKELEKAWKEIQLD